jgi:hypothetical protein
VRLLAEIDVMGCNFMSVSEESAHPFSLWMQATFS